MNAELMGFRIDNYTFEEGVNKAIELACSDKVSQIVTINPEMIEYALKNEDFANIIHNAEMIIPDGIGVKIGLKLNGYNVQRRPGIDFAYRLLEKSAINTLPVAIIGAKEEVINKAAENLNKKIPNLNIVYCHNGYFENDEEIYNNIREKSSKIILVAMGSPRQEIFINNAKAR